MCSTLLDALATTLRARGRTVGILSLDDQKIGGFEPLAIASEIIGEAARRLTKSFRDSHPEIPWTKIMGQRHVLAHD